MDQEIPEKARLLFLLSDDYVSAIVHNPEQKNVIDWRMYEKSNTYNSDSFFSSFTELTQLFSTRKQQVALLAITGRQILVPVDMANQLDLFSLASLQFPITHQDIFLQDSVASNEAVACFTLPKQMIQEIKSLFPELTVQHLFPYFLKQEVSATSEMTLSVLSSHFTLTIQHLGKWQMIKTHSFQTGEDIIYILLKAVEQLGIDPANVELHLEGFIHSSSELSRLLHHYFLNVHWRHPLQYSFPEKEGFEPHTFSFIDRILTCVS